MRDIKLWKEGMVMNYKRMGNTIIARIDRGEEIHEQLKNLALKENIKLASVQGLGATNNFTVGVLSPKDKKYYPNTFTGDFEIVSIIGTINTMNGEYYAHIHMSCGNNKGEVFGGHLTEATISVTCELVINVIDGIVDREFSDEIGINLYKFD